MAYLSIKRIKNGRYLYLNQSYRVRGLKHPKKKTTYIGPVSGGIALLQLAAKVGSDKNLQSQLKPIEARMKQQAAEFVVRVELKTGEAQKAATAWEAANAREGQNSAPKEGASSPSSNEGGQFSDQGDASGAA